MAERIKVWDGAEADFIEVLFSIRKVSCDARTTRP